MVTYISSSFAFFSQWRKRKFGKGQYASGGVSIGREIRDKRMGGGVVRKKDEDLGIERQ